MGLPAQDGGEAVVPVVEGQVPPPVLNTLKPVVGLVHWKLSEHAEFLPAPSLHLLSALQDRKVKIFGENISQSEAEDYELL